MKKRIYFLVTILTVSLVFFFISQGQILAKENSKTDYDSQESRGNVELVYPNYPKDKPEITKYRSHYSRTFRNNDGSCTTILTIRPTSYPIKKGGKVEWIDISPDNPIPASVLRILDQQTLPDSWYGNSTEIDNDGYAARYQTRSDSDPTRRYVAGAGAEWAGLNNHLYQRCYVQFTTTTIPTNATISAVQFRIYISSGDPDLYDYTEYSVHEQYDYYEIWPLIKDMYNQPSNYYVGPDNWGYSNNLFYDCGNGATYYNGGGYIWDRANPGYKYANFNSAGISDFQNYFDQGWYAFAVKDSMEKDGSFGYWEAVTISLYLSELTITYTAPGVEELEISKSLPICYLSQNSPNPVSERTIIKYVLPERLQVELKVYDESGREIITLLSKGQTAGHYKVNWDIRDVSKKKLPNGVYFYRLKAGNFTKTKKMVVVR